MPAPYRRPEPPSPPPEPVPIEPPQPVETYTSTEPNYIMYFVLALFAISILDGLK